MKTWMLESPEGEFEPCSIDDWLDANRECLPEEDRVAVLNLLPGEVYSAGGGAGAEWSVRRCLDRRS